MAIPVTLREQIEEQIEKDISYRSLHSSAYIEDADSGDVILVPFEDLISKYNHFLKPVLLYKELSDVEQAKYRFRPKMLSKDLYGNTELWHKLLTLNGAKSIMDFRPKTLCYYDPIELKPFINEILILEGVID